MIEYTTYRAATGEILGHGMHSTSTATAASSDGTVLQAAGSWDGAAFYVSDGVAVPRPAMGITASALTVAHGSGAAVTFSGVPKNVLCSIDGGSPQAVTDGLVELTCDHAGAYAVLFTLFPYLPQSFGITAT